MMVAVCKGVPLPDEPPAARPCLYYPLDRMDIGDSFTLPLIEYHKVASAAYRYGKRHRMKFTVRKIKKKGLVGVWRMK